MSHQHIVELNAVAVVRNTINGMMAGLMHAGIPCDMIMGESLFQSWVHLTSHHDLSFAQAREAISGLLDQFERDNAAGGGAKRRRKAVKTPVRTGGEKVTHLRVIPGGEPATVVKKRVAKPRRNKGA
jgi:hypothetical protein